MKTLRDSKWLYAILFALVLSWSAPVSARFIAVDPKADQYPSLSPYVYCANNPMKFVDPDGRSVLQPSTVAKMTGRPCTVSPLMEGIIYDIPGPSAIAGFGSKAVASPLKSLISRAIKRVLGKTDDLKGAAQAGAKRSGSKGLPDHQAKVAELGDVAKSQKKAGETVVKEQKVRGHNSRRIPDQQIVDEKNVTRKVFEAERRPNGKYHKERLKEYDNLGLEHETHEIK